MSSIYLIGSLRNPKVTQIARALREAGHDVFDDWYAAGPEADDYWQRYEQERGRTYAEALSSYAAQHVYKFDLEHLDRCDIGVLMLPAGKSGHTELGYMKGRGKQTFVLLEEAEPERWDVMYARHDGVFASLEELIDHLTPTHEEHDRLPNRINSDYPDGWFRRDVDRATVRAQEMSDAKRRRIGGLPYDWFRINPY